jgi:hypothetical protein
MADAAQYSTPLSSQVPETQKSDQQLIHYAKIDTDDLHLLYVWH